MSVIDRIKAKALQASTIAPNALKAFEADLDSLIAEGPKLEAEGKAAVAVHKEVVTGIRGEFDGMRAAIDILSNGGPLWTNPRSSRPTRRPCLISLASIPAKSSARSWQPKFGEYKR